MDSTSASQEQRTGKDKKGVIALNADIRSSRTAVKRGSRQRYGRLETTVRPMAVALNPRTI